MVSLLIYSILATIALIAVTIAKHKRNVFIKQKSQEYANKHEGGKNVN